MRITRGTLATHRVIFETTITEYLIHMSYHHRYYVFLQKLEKKNTAEDIVTPTQAPGMSLRRSEDWCASRASGCGFVPPSRRPTFAETLPSRGTATSFRRRFSLSGGTMVLRNDRGVYTVSSTRKQECHGLMTLRSFAGVQCRLVQQGALARAGRRLHRQSHTPCFASFECTVNPQYLQNVYCSPNAPRTAMRYLKHALACFWYRFLRIDTPHRIRRARHLCPKWLHHCSRRRLALSCRWQTLELNCSTLLLSVCIGFFAHAQERGRWGRKNRVAK